MSQVQGDLKRTARSLMISARSDQMLAFGGIPGGGFGGRQGGYTYTANVNGANLLISLAALAAARGAGAGGFAGILVGEQAVSRRRRLTVIHQTSLTRRFKGYFSSKTAYRVPSTGEQSLTIKRCQLGTYDGMKLRYKKHGEYGVSGVQ